ncbi:MAG: glycosyltransferase [Paludibacteraceae bacterium]|nr:glycosyltransferase [Paludibacteraceae bacterium]
MRDNRPIVAIRTLVYNHEIYLRDYFEGIIMQQTSFPFIAVIHDDCSTDSSAKIIREYADKYPEIIKPIFEEQNCYQNGLWSEANKKMEDAYKNAKYIAYCEGDDYWTDPKKLQRQVDFLETHPEYVAIAENGLVQNSVSNTEYPFNLDPSHDVSMEEAIIKRRFPTAGVMRRKETLDGFNEASRYSIDTIQWCWLISRGKLRYENIISSVYRKGEQGMTIYTEPFDLAKKVEQWNLEILRIFDIKKDFMYKHIAQSFYDCAKSALRRFHIFSTIKCSLYSIAYAIKSILAKIC